MSSYFLVLIAIQYVVINHGAVRISEVTARFTLDALPGKQMSIDADLNAGLIDESEARSPSETTRRRSGVLRRDGWCVALHQRDAIASILITGYQYSCRLSDRRSAAWNGSSSSARNLHSTDHRRWSRHGHSRADDLRLRVV